MPATENYAELAFRIVYEWVMESEAKPLQRLRIIGGNTLSEVVHLANHVLGGGVAVDGQWLQELTGSDIVAAFVGSVAILKWAGNSSTTHHDGHSDGGQNVREHGRADPRGSCSVYIIRRSRADHYRWGDAPGLRRGRGASFLVDGSDVDAASSPKRTRARLTLTSLICPLP